jgi:hypothetical protein
VLNQIILETAYQQVIPQNGYSGEISPATQAIMDISTEISNDKGGSLSRSIFFIAQLQREGNIEIANQAILNIAKHLAIGGNVNDIPQIIKEFVNSVKFMQPNDDREKNKKSNDDGKDEDKKDVDGNVPDGPGSLHPEPKDDVDKADKAKSFLPPTSRGPLVIPPIDDEGDDDVDKVDKANPSLPPSSKEIIDDDDDEIIDDDDDEIIDDDDDENVDEEE